MKPSTTPPPAVAVNFTFLVLYLAGLSAFGSFVNDMYTPSLPSMRHYFDCSVPEVQLGLTMGMLGLGIGQILLGPVSFHYGRKPVLTASIIFFIAAATVSIFSPTIHFFLACRFLQGIGASGGYFLARTIPADVYGGRKLAKAMAVMGAINGFAPASAPVIGGFISEKFDWKGIFVVLIAFAVILLCIAPKLKETLPASARPATTVLQNFSNYPALLRNRRFMIHALFKGSALGLLFAYMSSAPFIMQTHFGLSPSHFGLYIGANSLFVAAGSMTALRFKPLKNAGLAGAILLMSSVLILSVALWCIDNFWAYELLLLPMLFALGMIFTVTNTLAMNEGKAVAGAASAVLGIVGYIFGAIAAPIVGMGDIMHSTASVMTVLAAITLVFAVRARRIPADLE
ncbi:MAG: multidrug effflux MFS transporter [Muribaculaceae bacterium]|nr:multidrug effflux MFS transporter [Muribaculaceae bacterium]